MLTYKEQLARDVLETELSLLLEGEDDILLDMAWARATIPNPYAARARAAYGLHLAFRRECAEGEARLEARDLAFALATREREEEGEDATPFL